VADRTGSDPEELTFAPNLVSVDMYDMDFPDLSHLRQLRADLWQWPKSRAAVMVGAGFSLNAEPLPGVRRQFPKWQDLSRAMIDELHPSEPAEARAKLSNADPLRIASQYEAAFDKRKLDLFIRAQIPDSDYAPVNSIACSCGCRGPTSSQLITTRFWRKPRLTNGCTSRSLRRAS